METEETKEGEQREFELEKPQPKRTRYRRRKPNLSHFGGRGVDFIGKEDLG